MAVLAAIAACLAGIGAAQCLAGWAAVLLFARRRDRPQTRSDPPPVTVLKPLHGSEPLLEEGLASLCRQRYPVFQVIFGVQDCADPAIGIVRRLQSRFPGHDLVLVEDPTQHGANRKVSNLINMVRAARHDVLVIADSDLHVTQDYLRSLLDTLGRPGTGLVTTLYAGFPAERLLPSLLGATQITHCFLPGALLARGLGRQDCLGATMALRRETLDRIGGLQALVEHLADDNALGRLVQGLGLSVRLADTVPLTTVPEATFAALFTHELRWARTIRALVPAQFAASALQYPIAWALLSVLLAVGAAWSWGVLAAAWAVRALAARGVDRALARTTGRPGIAAPLWLLPLRDLMSVGVMAASYAGLRVEWRGHVLRAGRAVALSRAAEARGTEPQGTEQGPKRT